MPTVVEVLVAAGVVASKSAGRRTIEEGGAYLNNVKVDRPGRADLDAADLLHGRYVVVRRGRKTVGALRVSLELTTRAGAPRLDLTPAHRLRNVHQAPPVKRTRTDKIWNGPSRGAKPPLTSTG